jgi:hypothetical protein
MNNYSVETGIALKKAEPAYQPLQQIIPIPVAAINPAITATSNTKNILSFIKEILPDVIIIIYALITLILVARIAFQIIFLISSYLKSYKVHLNNCVLLYNHKFRTTFSFFRWIFVYHDQSTDAESEYIITHEKAHVRQVHSFDMMIIELLAAAMWFNPLIRMMKRSLQLVHEYLADEGVLKTGIDKISYQALIINQVAGENLVSLSSGFSSVCQSGRQSSIKKRIIMLTRSKISKGVKFKLMALLPATLLLLMAISVINGLNAGASAMPLSSVKIISPDTITEREVNSVPTDTIKRTEITRMYVKEGTTDTIVEKEINIVTGRNVEVSKNVQDEKVIILNEKDGKKHKYVTVTASDVDAHVYMSMEDDDQNRILIHADTIVFHSIRDKERSNILYIIDGKPSSDLDPISLLNPDDIQSIEVIKGTDMKKYTSGEYDGVIVITSRE